MEALRVYETDRHLGEASLGLSIGIEISSVAASGISLSHANLGGVIFSSCVLRNADFSGANLANTWFIECNLRGDNFSKSNFVMTVVGDTSLKSANFKEAELSGSYFGNADLQNANLEHSELAAVHFKNTDFHTTSFKGARLANTVFSNVNLSNAIELDTCQHSAPSAVDYLTLKRSSDLPLGFLRGVGFPDALISSLTSINVQGKNMPNCFFSYSHKDDSFAQKLYEELQSSGIRCWMAPHDLKIGAKSWDAIDEAIQTREKVLLILSRNSINSDWVEDEVLKSYATERERKKTVLLSIRIDNTVLSTSKPWARKLRDQRNIADFSKWKNDSEYNAALAKLIDAVRSTV